MTSKEKTKSLVNKASTDDRIPPSGYLLKELASRTMSISECQTIEDLVIKKLAKSKPYIKYKSLRIVKYLCDNGSPNWRRAWQRNTDKLRDAQQFRGPPDPVFGDAPYQQVRKAAKDAMQAVFQQSTIDSSHIKNRIKGVDGGSAYSSSSYSNTNASNSIFGSGSRGVYGGPSIQKKSAAPSAPASWDKKPMPGHGNTSYQPTVRTTTFEPLKSSGVYSNPAVLAGTNAHSRGKLDTRHSGQRKKGRAGGVWGGVEEEEDEEEYELSGTYEDEFPSSDRYEKPKKKIGSFGGNIKKRSKPSSGQYEKKWVDDIVKSGGVGSRIVNLPKYVSQFENLSKSHVLEHLDETLEGSQWQKKGKSLTLIEALIKGRSSEDVIDYFSQSPDNVQALQTAKKSILRKKANAIMEYLDVEEEEEEDEEEEEEEEVSITITKESISKPHEDLLNMGVVEEEDDMFANMNRQKQAQEKKQQDLLGGDMFADMNKPTQSSVQMGDANDIMNIMGDAVGNSNNNISAAGKRKKENYAFLDIVANETNVTQQDHSGDILNMGFNKPTAAQTQPAAQSGGDSAFGFDLGGGGDAPAQPSGGGASAFGFDLGGGGDANTGANNVSGGGGASAFGFDLGGGGDIGGSGGGGDNMNNQPQVPQTKQSMNSMNRNNMQQRMGGSPMQTMMNPMNNMMTQQMIASNMNNMQQMQNMMRQMQQMQMNVAPNQMNPHQMNAHQMNMMNMNMQQMNPQQNSLFTQAMANMNNPAMNTQTQRPQTTYSQHNDPFAQMMSGNPQQTNVATQRPKKTGPDPFAQFGLNSLK